MPAFILPALPASRLSPAQQQPLLTRPRPRVPARRRPRLPRATLLAPSPLLSLLPTPSLLLSANPAWLETIASAFRTLNMPSWLVEYGHPAMMAFMVLAMGFPAAAIGWAGRLNADRKAGVKQKRLHESIMVAFFLLAFLGGTGGTLSIAMQGFDVWQSAHFKSAVVVLIMLGFNATLAYSGFTIGNDGSPKGRLQGRKLHAWFGVAVMTVFLVHGLLGVNILLD